jgi:hypothetical protein
MPNKGVDGLRINSVDPMLDKRRKLTDKEKQDIRDWYAMGDVGTRVIAREYGVSKRTIQFILDPEKLRENLRRRHERGGHKLYYDRERHRKAVADLRRRKRELIEDGRV